MDVFSRTIFAITQISVSIVISSIGRFNRCPFRSYFRIYGGVDRLTLTRISEVIQGFPQILFGMAFIAATSNSLWNVVLVVAFCILCIRKWLDQ